jgi:hypothetical protein
MTVVIDGSNGITFPNSTIQASSSKVLQVIQATSTAVDSTSNSGFVSTSLSLSITPKFSTSSILLMSTATIGMSTLNIAKYAFARNGSVLNGGGTGWGASYLNPPSTPAQGYPWSEVYLDSPATTSATTYAVYFGVDSGGPAWFNSRSTSNGGLAVLIAMEIAA